MSNIVKSVLIVAVTMAVVYRVTVLRQTLLGVS